jgi:hypothetical protein
VPDAKDPDVGCDCLVFISTQKTPVAVAVIHEKNWSFVIEHVDTYVNFLLRDKSISAEPHHLLGSRGVLAFNKFGKAGIGETGEHKCRLDLADEHAGALTGFLASQRETAFAWVYL